MSNKEDILSKFRKNIIKKYDMPRLDDIKGITYPDPLVQFISMTENVGGKVVELKKDQDINQLIKELYPDAKEIASNLPEVTIATRNPDTIGSPQALNGTDVGVIKGMFGVAENACVWIPQTMVEKAVCFISENLVILLDRTEIVEDIPVISLKGLIEMKRALGREKDIRDIEEPIFGMLFLRKIAILKAILLYV